MVLFAIKSIRQSYFPNEELESMMETFRQMVNECIRIGLESQAYTLKKLALLSYHQLKDYPIPAKYKLTAISQACGRLSHMKRLIKKGSELKSPFITKAYLVSCYDFKIYGRLLSIPVGNRKYINIVLNQHTEKLISQPHIKVKSFTITPNSLSLCIQREVSEIKAENVVGIDRNLRNVTIGNQDSIIMYRTNKLLSIKENTNHVVESFKRNDHRIRQKIYSKIGNRRTRRIQQYLHKISKDIVQRAKKSKSIIVFEDLKGIRKLYRKGNGQGHKYRRKLNSWSFYELQRQIQYKAVWDGIPVRFVSPVRTSQLCPRCGNRTQEDKFQHRQLWCNNCKRSMNRDVVAAINVSYKGWARFIHPRGLSDEAMKGNVENLQPLILRVDGSKFSSSKILSTKSLQNLTIY